MWASGGGVEIPAEFLPYYLVHKLSLPLVQVLGMEQEALVMLSFVDGLEAGRGLAEEWKVRSQPQSLL